MQAVHWIAGSGLYDQAPGHGPKWGETTVRIAQEIAALTECRPSVDYLTRKLGLSPRTVKYHLGHLRAAGLLVYRSKGTRLVGRVRLASVYERVIPVQFDQALGIRTVLRDETAPEYTRVPVGIVEESRKTIGDLARKAARKIRAKRTKRGVDKSVDTGARCTPMQVGTSAVPSAGSSSLPSESKLARGKKSSPTPKQQKPKARKLNQVGRRYQLARELITAVPWLGKAAVPRIAWIVRRVADAGWTCDEVRAFLAVADVDLDPRRPSGFLAARLKAAPLGATKEQRRAAVEAWHWAEENARKARITAVRHQRDTSVETTLPQTAPAQRQWAAAVADTAGRTLDEVAVVAADDCLAIEDLPRETVRAMRVEAERDPGLIHAALQDGMSETDVRRLYTNRLVDRALRTPAAF
ncbi:helix-turn-helix domain-containing protein [Streptomyces hydrogenans]|uniref:helix-turn-helix domain-containing protein n=1 Tax=Streptomyces hydrogenans TaxID=1873719 RepID=UPI0036EF939B